MKKVWRSAGIAAAFVAGGFLLLDGASAAQPLPGPAVGPNVNMASGTRWPEGDPLMTKRNEPSLGVSSRNPRHLLAGSNDYRLVAAEVAESLTDPEAWIQVYKSVDGGESWYSTPLPGCPLAITECTDLNAQGQPITGLYSGLLANHPNFGADPTVRPGPYGTLFLTFIAGTRGTGANGVVAVQRYVDKNNDVQRGTDVRGKDAKGNAFVRPAQDPILPDVLNIVDTGTPGQSKDKPWVAADVGGRKWNKGRTCELLSWTKNKATVTNSAETVGAFSVYVSYANFTGTNNQPQIYVAESSDCGNTFAKGVRLTMGGTANQGTVSAIDPQTGAVYVAWRAFSVPGTTNVDAILISSSTDGGATWSKPVQVAAIKPYDQGSTNVSIRTLGFPTLAVSVGSDGKSRVHAAWAQRTATPSTSSPYGCPSANWADCDARIVMSTSLDGGTTWSAPAAVSTPPAGNDPFNPNVGRGNQIQPAMTFAAGKLLITWLDQRLDSTEGQLQCPNGTITDCEVSQMAEVRVPRGNLDPSCTFPSPPARQGGPTGSCYLANTVFTPYISDGTAYLVRRHTLDVFAATAMPADVPIFTTSRASQYTFGTTVQGTVVNGKLKPVPGTYAIRQKQVNAVNLPMFAQGTGAFLGDYIDVGAQLIVATTDPSNPYKFNVGGSANTQFTTGGRASTFHLTFTDNRNVIPPSDGHWETPTCNTSAFTKDSNGNVTGVTNANSCNGTGKPGPGFSGNRNQNVYTAIVGDHSLTYANFNSKLLNTATYRRFAVTVQNLSSIARNYKLDVGSQASGATAVLDETTGATNTDATGGVTVQPGSSATRIVSAKSSNGNAQVVVNVTTSSDASWSTKVLLNPDPNGVFVTNGDPAGTPDTANDNLGNVVLSNAVLTNNALSNNALSNNVLSNNALTNAVLSNVMLSNNVLSNLTDPNNALSNAVLSNVVLSNVVLTNQSIGNVVLSNNVLTNVVLTNNALNAALSNLDPTNVALSNVVLSNNALTNVVLSNVDPNNALSNAVLSNVALSNAVLSNVVLSNNALSNNVLSNNVLSNVVLSNASISDQQTNAQNSGNPDLDPLRAIETGSPELTPNLLANGFTSADLGASSNDNLGFKDMTFTVRNHGNTDTMLSVKMLLRDAVGCTGQPPYNSCQPPSTFKLLVTLRKVAFNPTAIPPTNPAVSSGQTFQLGLAQRNAEVSNVGNLALIDPADPNFGKFQPLDPNAATLPLAAGEWAYVTIRAIGVNGTTPPDPADLLQWGAKAISANATTTTGPLVITSLGVPTVPTFIATAPQDPGPPLQTFGGTVTQTTGITGSAVCTDKTGAPILSGAGAPTLVAGPGAFYIDTAGKQVYGPKTGTATDSNNWGGPTPQIVPIIAGVGSPAVAAPPGSYYIDTSTKLIYGPKGGTLTDSNNWGLPSPELVPLTSGTGSPEGVVSGAPGSYFIDTAGQVVYGPKAGSGTTATTAGWGLPTALGLPTTFIARFPCPQALSIGPIANRGTFTTNTSTQVSTSTLNFTPSYWGDFYAAVSVADASTPAQTDKQVIKVHVNPRPPVVTFPGFPSQIQFDNTQDLRGVFHSDSPVAPVFSASVSATNACYVDANGYTLHVDRSLTDPTGAGNTSLCVVTVSQAGNETFAPVSLQTPAITVTQANVSINFGALPGRTYGDAQFAISATSSTSASVPSPSPIVFSSTSNACTTSGTNGTTITITNAGGCTVDAGQAATPNYKAPTTAPESFTVAPKQVSVTTSANSKVFGSADPIPLTTSTPGGFVSGDSPVNVTYSRAPGEVVGTYPITATVTSLAAGRPLSNYIITYLPVPASNFTITPVPTTTVTATSRSPSPTGQSVTFTATVAPSALPPAAATGNVEFFDGTTSLGTSSLSGGTASISTSSLIFGTHTIKSVYSGDGNYKPSTSAVLSQVIDGFSPTADMLHERSGHTATLLGDGNVLVVGGVDSTGTPQATAEVYCTAVGGSLCTAADVFKAVVGSMATARVGHAATLLADGTVLVTGGEIDMSGTVTNTAEVYCAVAAGPLCTANDVGTFKPTTGPMSSNRTGHTATLLPDNTVLIAGGFSDAHNPPTPPTATSDIYCAVGGSCTAATFTATTTPMGSARANHTATLVADGTVLIAGGEVDATGTPTNTAEIYCSAVANPPCAAADAGTYKSVMSVMSVARSSHTATTLQDNRVLIAGGETSGMPTPTASADVYCAVAAANCASNLGTFQRVGSLVVGRTLHTSTLLTDGSALVVGGLGATNTQLNSSELFDPGANNFTTDALMSIGRAGATATLLLDGRVLVTGGQTTTGTTTQATKTAEVYQNLP